MRDPFRSSCAILVLTLAAASPRAALAFDLTGNWEGKWKCKVVDNGQKSSGGNPDSTAAITQAGTVFGATIDDSLPYTGFAIADARKDAKGIVGFIHCGSDDDLTQGAFTEFGTWKVVTKDAKGSLNGVSIWSQSSTHIGICKYKYKRVDTVDPAVPTACP